MTTIASYRLVSKDLPAALERVAQRPDVQRDTSDYLSRIGSIKSVDAFVADDRLYRFAMKAFGMDDLIYAKALIKRVLREGIDQRTALANRLADPRYREFTEALNFARHGAAATSFTRAQSGVADRYVRQTLEVDAGRQNEGVRLALYFQRKAPAVTNAYGLLADRALLKVTQVALGLSESTAAIDIEKQAELIGKRLDVADLKTPEKLDRLLTRFAALWDIENPSTGTASASVGLVSGTVSGLSLDALGQLQNLTKRR